MSYHSRRRSRRKSSSKSSGNTKEAQSKGESLAKKIARITGKTVKVTTGGVTKRVSKSGQVSSSRSSGSSSSSSSSNKYTDRKKYTDTSGVVRYEGTTGYKASDYNRAVSGGQVSKASGNIVVPKKRYTDRSGVIRYEGTTGYKASDYNRAQVPQALLRSDRFAGKQYYVDKSGVIRYEGTTGYREPLSIRNQELIIKRAIASNVPDYLINNETKRILQTASGKYYYAQVKKELSKPVGITNTKPTLQKVLSSLKYKMKGRKPTLIQQALKSVKNDLKTIIKKIKNITNSQAESLYQVLNKYKNVKTKKDIPKSMIKDWVSFVKKVDRNITRFDVLGKIIINTKKAIPLFKTKAGRRQFWNTVYDNTISPIVGTGKSISQLASDISMSSLLIATNNYYLLNPTNTEKQKRTRTKIYNFYEKAIKNKEARRLRWKKDMLNAMAFQGIILVGAYTGGFGRGVVSLGEGYEWTRAVLNPTPTNIGELVDIGFVMGAGNLMKSNKISLGKVKTSFSKLSKVKKTTSGFFKALIGKNYKSKLNTFLQNGKVTIQRAGLKVTLIGKSTKTTQAVLEYKVNGKIKKTAVVVEIIPPKNKIIEPKKESITLLMKKIKVRLNSNKNIPSKLLMDYSQAVYDNTYPIKRNSIINKPLSKQTFWKGGKTINRPLEKGYVIEIKKRFRIDGLSQYVTLVYKVDTKGSKKLIDVYARDAFASGKVKDKKLNNIKQYKKFNPTQRTAKVIEGLRFKKDYNSIMKGIKSTIQKRYYTIRKKKIKLTKKQVRQLKRYYSKIENLKKSGRVSKADYKNIFFIDNNGRSFIADGIIKNVPYTIEMIGKKGKLNKVPYMVMILGKVKTSKVQSKSLVLYDNKKSVGQNLLNPKIKDMGIVVAIDKPIKIAKQKVIYLSYKQQKTIISRVIRNHKGSMQSLFSILFGKVMGKTIFNKATGKKGSARFNLKKKSMKSGLLESSHPFYSLKQSKKKYKFNFIYEYLPQVRTKGIPNIQKVMPITKLQSFRKMRKVKTLIGINVARIQLGKIKLKGKLALAQAQKNTVDFRKMRRIMKIKEINIGKMRILNKIKLQAMLRAMKKLNLNFALFTESRGKLALAEALKLRQDTLLKLKLKEITVQDYKRVLKLIKITKVPVTKPKKPTTKITKPRVIKIKKPIDTRVFKVIKPNPKIKKDEKPPKINKIKLRLPPKKKPKSKARGYYVYIKSRGKWVKAYSKPLKKETARRFGRYVIDNSAEASYRVQATTKKAIKLKVIPKVKSIFRHSKRKPKVRVEKRKYRINTRGEKRSISYKGIVASLIKRKKYKKKKAKRKKRSR